MTHAAHRLRGPMRTRPFRIQEDGPRTTVLGLWTERAILDELTLGDLHAVLRSPETCDAGASRAGRSKPCEKPAVAVADVMFEGERLLSPVCAFHARAGIAGLLSELLRLLKGGRE